MKSLRKRLVEITRSVAGKAEYKILSLSPFQELAMMSLANCRSRAFGLNEQEIGRKMSEVGCTNVTDCLAKCRDEEDQCGTCPAVMEAALEGITNSLVKAKDRAQQQGIVDAQEHEEE